MMPLLLARWRPTHPSWGVLAGLEIRPLAVTNLEDEREQSITENILYIYRVDRRARGIPITP